MLSVLQVIVPSVLCFVVPSFAILLLLQVILTNQRRRSFPIVSWSAIVSLATFALLAGIIGFTDHPKTELGILTCLYTELSASVIYLAFKHTSATPWLVPYTLSLSLSLFCVSVTCFTSPYIPPLPPLISPLISLLFTLVTLPLLIYPIYSHLSSTTKFRFLTKSKSRIPNPPPPRALTLPTSPLSSTVSFPQLPPPPPHHIYISSLSSLSTLPPFPPKSSPMGSDGLEAQSPEQEEEVAVSGFQHDSIPLRRYPCRSDSRRYRHRQIVSTKREGIYHLQQEQQQRGRNILFTLLASQLFSLSSGIFLLTLAAIGNHPSSASDAGVINSSATNTTLLLRVVERVFMVLDVCGVIFAFFLHGIPLEQGDGSPTSHSNNTPATRNQDQEEATGAAGAGFNHVVDFNITKSEQEAHHHHHSQVHQQQLQFLTIPSATANSNPNNAAYHPSGGEPITAAAASTTATTNRVGRSCTIKLPPSGLRIFTSNITGGGGGVEDKQGQGEAPRQYATTRHRRFDSTSSSFSSPRLKRTPIIPFDHNKDHGESTPIDSDDDDNDNNSDDYGDDDDEEFELPILTKDGRATHMQLPSPPDTPVIVVSNHHHHHRESWPQQQQYHSEEVREKKRPSCQTLSVPSSLSPSPLVVVVGGGGGAGMPTTTITTTNPRPSPKLPSLPLPTTPNTSPHKRSLSSLPLSKADWYPFISRGKIARSYSIVGNGIGNSNGNDGGGGRRRSNTEPNGGSSERADFVDLTDPFASPPPPDLARLSRENINDLSPKGKMRASTAAATADTKKNSSPPPPPPPPPPSCYRNSESSSSLGSVAVSPRTRLSKRADSPMPFMLSSPSSPYGDKGGGGESGSLYSTRGRRRRTSSNNNSSSSRTSSTATTIRRKGSPLPMAFRSSLSLSQPSSPSNQRRTVSEGTPTTTATSRVCQKSSSSEKDEAAAAVTAELLNLDEVLLAQRLLTRLDSVSRDGYF